MEPLEPSEYRPSIDPPEHRPNTDPGHIDGCELAFYEEDCAIALCAEGCPILAIQTARALEIAIEHNFWGMRDKTNEGD